MISNRDIYASAKALILAHGNKAEDKALDKMLELTEKDDAKGAAVWLGIMSAIADLQAIKKQKYLM